MSEENHHHHHHLFGHHKKDGEGEVEDINKPVSHINEYQEAQESAIPIEKTEYYEGPPHDTHDNDKGHVNDNDAHDDAKKQEKSATHKEHVGEAIGAAAVAFALHEKHEAKKDEEHVGRHKLEEKFAEAVAISAGGYALHEHHEKKEAKEEAEEAGGEEHKKKHHFF